MAAQEAEVTKRPKRKYDAAFKAEALTLLKANKDNVYATAEQLNIPRLTLREWAKNGRGITPEVVAIQHRKEHDMAERYGVAASIYLEHAIDPLTVSATSGLEAMKSSAIATDKQQLLLGNPTSITRADLSDDEKKLRLVEILTRIRTRSEAARIPLQETSPDPAEQPQPVAVLQG